jgi:hypothetical protein
MDGNASVDAEALLTIFVEDTRASNVISGGLDA